MKKSFLQMIKFSMVGLISTIIEYIIYLISQFFVNYNIAFTIGYFTSFIVNYQLSVYYTFKTKPSLKNGIGFSFAHISNYILHIVLLNIFVNIGIPEWIALIPVYIIAIPTNYILVRFVFNHF